MATRLGILAFSVLLSSTALAGLSFAGTGSQGSLAQNIEGSVRDAQAKRAGGDYAGAVKILSQLMLVAPDDARIVAEYGKVLVQQGRSREALDFLKRAVQLQTSDWTLYSALGVAYDQAGDYTNARSAYERALQLKPGEGAVLNNYAMSRAQAGDLTLAKTLIAQAAAASKDDRVGRNAKMIASLTAPIPGKAPLAPAPAALSKDVASAPPRTLTSQEGKSVVMQAVPTDSQAGQVNKPRKATKAASAKKSDGIPSLRLANDQQ